MIKDSDIKIIEEKIGYVFKDKDLLVRAFTHPSFSKDVNLHYETLEFLGDSIVDFVVAEKLFSVMKNADEGVMTKVRAQVVSETPLAEAIDPLRISDFAQMGVGETRRKFYDSNAFKCDLFESITAAIYLDGGMENAKKFALNLLDPKIVETIKTDNFENCKSRLNEVAEKKALNISYQQIGQSGPSHKPVFEFVVLVDGKEYGKGIGTSKREAQEACAKIALEKLS